MPGPRVLAFSGSARRESFNQRLVSIAANYARSAGASVTLIGLGDLNLPLFNEDLEREMGAPEGALRLKQLMFDHGAFLVACPEYNSSITPLLKNAIDWASRPAVGETPLQAFKGKVCGLMSASQGALGGLRGLVHVRSILGNIGVLVVSEQVALGGVAKMFAESGDDLQEGPQKKMLQDMVQRVMQVAGKLAG